MTNELTMTVTYEQLSIWRTLLRGPRVFVRHYREARGSGYGIVVSVAAAWIWSSILFHSGKKACA